MTAVVAGTEGAAQASLSSLPNTPFLIQFFSNTTPDPSGYGQGQTLLGSQAVTTDANGMAVVSLSPQDGVPASTWVSATATNLVTGDTSEFAAGPLGTARQRSVHDDAVRRRFVGGRGDDPGRARWAT